jgi:predicted enzyme related to lactoylglutathione lyase
MSITGVHAILMAEDADAVRAFLRDTLELKSVDAGGGWLIFALPPAELAAHPADANGTSLYLMCDDLEATMAELRAKGIEFSSEPQDAGYGISVTMLLPGGTEMQLYEPRHELAIGKRS